ncbi:hypothetical protein DEO72_LG7g1887 [Vigna unguiculata]|uniref:Uncharacterized protein n=1 Tax=Vigna unguiculata TaxID=3917 RepID=A0A4D6MKR3_VIGUN|nr:hypothetical protein DEO72_LG7g1887 [Vigna unguiculata]
MIEGVGLEEGGQFVVDDEGQKELEGDVEGEKELDEEDEQVMLMAKKSEKDEHEGHVEVKEFSDKGLVKWMVMKALIVT